MSEDTSGFYKRDPGGDLLHAPNFVYAPTFTLDRDAHATYDYPIDGWVWVDAGTDPATVAELAPGWAPSAPGDPVTFDNPALEQMEPT